MITLIIYVIIGMLVASLIYGVINIDDCEKNNDIVISGLAGMFWVVIVPMIILAAVLCYPMRKLYKLGQNINDKLELFK